MSFSLLKNKIVLVVLALVLVGVGIGVYKNKTQVKKVAYTQVKRGTVEQTIEVPGKVDATIKAELKFLAGGKLVSLPSFEGQEVKKGQRIASIDASDLQKNLESSLRDYSSSRADFDQGIDDRKDEALSDSLKRAANKLQNTLDKSVISVELRDIAIKNATLVSPIDGVVTAVPVDTPGVQVLVTDVFEVVNPRTLYFKAEVDEADIGSVVQGTPVRVSLDAYPNDQVDGVISFIGWKAQSSSKSSGGTIFPVKVLLPNVSMEKFRLGMNGTMTIILAKKENVLTIPLEATSQNDGKVTVKVKSSNNADDEVRQIQTGIEGNTSVEVLSGLREDDQVVLP